MDEEKNIYAAVGEALTKWAALEDELCLIYCEAVSPKASSPSPAEHAFWTVISFVAKLKMTNVAMKVRLEKYPRVLDEWDAIHDQFGDKNKNRNRLAHGSICTIIHNQGKENESKDVFFVPYYYRAIRGYFHNFPEFGARILTKIPDDRLSVKLIGDIIQGYVEFQERLKKFLLSLRQIPL